LTGATEGGRQAESGQIGLAPHPPKTLHYTPAETDPCFVGVFHTLNQRHAQLYY